MKTRKKKAISKPKDLNKTLELLEELNYIKIVKKYHEGPGRPPAPIIKSNPLIGTFNTINTIKGDQNNNKEYLEDIKSIDTDLELKS